MEKYNPDPTSVCMEFVDGEEEIEEVTVNLITCK
jgi:hypothetical protein